MSADLAHLCSAFDIDAQFDAECLSDDGLDLQHGRFRQNARCRVRPDHIERCLRQYADQIEADVADTIEWLALSCPQR
jgi:hypothetical protein